MAFECGRARAYYLRAGGALAPEDRASLAPAEAMRLIYERLLARIEARHFDVFGPKVTLPRYEKVTLALDGVGPRAAGGAAAMSQVVVIGGGFAGLAAAVELAAQRAAATAARGPAASRWTSLLVHRRRQRRRRSTTVSTR